MSREEHIANKVGKASSLGSAEGRDEVRTASLLA